MRIRPGYGRRSEYSGIQILFQFLQRDLDVVHVLTALIDLLPQTTGNQALHFSGNVDHHLAGWPWIVLQNGC